MLIMPIWGNKTKINKLTKNPQPRTTEAAAATETTSTTTTTNIEDSVITEKEKNIL